MIRDASFQWVCRTANPFAREVLSGFGEGAGETDTLPGVAEVHAAPLSRCMRVLDALVRSADEFDTLAESPSGAGSATSQAAGRHDSWGAEGRTVMIGSPRAGYGKTHLVARLRSTTRGAVTILPLDFDTTETISWRHLLRHVLTHFDTATNLDGGGRAVNDAKATTLWQETGRRFFAEAYLVAEQAGGLDDAAPEADAAVLRREYANALSPETASQLRDWILENCYRLGETSAPEIGSQWRIDGQALPMWIDCFRRSTLEAASTDERAAILRSIVPAAGEDAEALAKARLGELLRMASNCRPLALVVDHLDGFYGRADAAMPLANLFASLRGMVRRSVTLLCLNQDIWESVFEGNLPSALTDRLTGEPAALESLSPEQAVALVRQRLDRSGAEAAQAQAFVDLLVQREGWSKASAGDRSAILYPRGVLRRASATWEWLVDGIEAGDSGVAKAATDVEAGKGTSTSAPAASPRSSAVGSLPLPLIGAGGGRVPGLQRERGGRGGSSMIDLESIVSEIRTGGARAISEGPATGDLSPAGGVNGHGSHGSAGATATAAVEAVQSPAISAHESELRRRVAGHRHGEDDLPWLIAKVERLVGEVGARFPAVAQTEAQIGGQSYLRWTVRGRAVLLGFTSAADDGFWRRLSKRSDELVSGTDDAQAAKVVRFTPASRAAEERSSLAEPSIDLIELHKDDLALLYAADDMIRSAALATAASGPDGNTDELEATVRFVARRMDPFWRRLTRPKRG